MNPLAVRWRRALLFLVVGSLARLSGPSVSASPAPAPERLRVSANGRALVDPAGRPVFLLADTAWSLAARLGREDAESYLRHRRAQRFNAVTFVIFLPGRNEITNSTANYRGRAPFKLVDGRPDPSQPDTRPGPDDDFWDDLDWLVATTRRLGFYAILLPTWGSGVAGTYAGVPDEGVVFNPDNARAYGRWLAARYRHEPHLLWMLGGDRPALYPKTGRDYRPVIRGLAAGLREGDPAALLSYHSAKQALQSGDSFHAEDWLAFNSIQHWPEEQVPAITRDWQRVPPKPTWIFEGRYEGYWKNKYKAEDWGEWQVRQQAWPTVLAGAFGHTYGHERVFGFGFDGADWRPHLDAPGARSLTHLARLMAQLTPAELLEREPDPALLEGDPGRAERVKSDRITAARTSDGRRAIFYSASGRPVRVKLARLARGPCFAWWYNPRTGGYHTGAGESAEPRPFAQDVPSGPGAPVREFAPPTNGAGIDWVLVLGTSPLRSAGD